MQDYGQPGGPVGTPPVGGAVPPPKKKGGKGLMIVGVILLIVGILIAIVGMMPMMTAEKAADIKDKDYEEGDQVTVSGEITNKSEIPTIDAYMFVLDEEIGFISSEDIGNEGDNIIVNCEVTEMDFGLGNQKILEAKSVANPWPLMIVGIILLVVGILLMVVGIKKKKKA